MSDAQIQDAAWAVQSVTGTSGYLYSIGYNHAQFLQELDRVVAHIKQAAQHG